MNGSAFKAPLPHLDHVAIDMQTGHVRITGAIYLGREGRIRHVPASKIEFHREFDEVEQLLRDEPDNPYGEQVLADIEHDNKLLAIIRKVIPD